MEKNHRNRLITKTGSRTKGGLDCGATVLPVIDDEASAHRHMQQAKAGILVGGWLEVNVRINRGCQCGKDVTCWLFCQISRHLGHSGLVQCPLSPQFRGELFLVEQKDFRNELQRAHRHKILAPGLDAPNGWENILEGLIHIYISAADVHYIQTQLVFVIQNNKHAYQSLRTGHVGMTVYLDNNATTPLDPEVQAALFQAFEVEYGNAGSRTHAAGLSAKKAVERARQSIALAVGAQAADVTFTSGATEASNLAILGLSSAGIASRRKHIVTTTIEHKAVLEPVDHLQTLGFEVTHVSVGPSGRVDADAVLAAVRPDTHLVSVMHANNETGVLQPITEIAERLEGESFFHVDAAQTFGKVFDDLCHPRIDLISATAHKIYGPKGVGALIARRRGFSPPPLAPLMFGGGQERGLRPGTLPVPLILAFGVAIDIARRDVKKRAAQCLARKEQAISALGQLEYRIIGDRQHTLPHVLSISFPGIDSEALMLATRQLAAVSNGSACTSSSYKPSHVLEAMGLSRDEIEGAVRLSWSHMTGEIPWAEFVEVVAGLADL